jgi:hypothetical protein
MLTHEVKLQKRARERRLQRVRTGRGRAISPFTFCAAHRNRAVLARHSTGVFRVASLWHSVGFTYRASTLRALRLCVDNLPSSASFASKLSCASLRTASPARKHGCVHIRHRCAAPVTFFVRAKKVTKEIAPRFAAKLINCLVTLCFSPRPAAAELTCPHVSWQRNLRVRGSGTSSASLVRQSSPKSPSSPAMLGASHGSKHIPPRSMVAAVAVDTPPRCNDIELRETDASLSSFRISPRPLRLCVDNLPSSASFVSSASTLSTLFHRAAHRVTYVAHPADTCMNASTLAHRTGFIYQASTPRPLRLRVDNLLSSASFASKLFFRFSSVTPVSSVVNGLSFAFARGARE